jgi:ADP-heptose:LPS heptosyltransferase
LLSLPLAFKTTLETIPVSGRYLAGDPIKVARWRSKLGSKSRPRVGLVWSGNAIHKNDANRSIRLDDLLKRLPAKIEYVSVQKDVRACDRQALESHRSLLNYSADLHDFSDTAALCECLDLLISVDTSVAHLCGSLGKETWILLPFNPDWRWLLDRRDSPWYPSVSLYRQSTAGEWDSVLDQVRADLADKFC